jgi:pimeloyl-ACP methyl ester carboxylesterase
MEEHQAVALRFATVLLLLLLAGCGHANPAQLAQGLAAGAGFERLEIQTTRFRLLAYVRGHGPVARIYIEGDGHPWADRYTRSDDPTPWNPVGLELAVADPASAVAWLARPCQYLLNLNNRVCSPIWWTDRRYHESVIASVDQALDRLRERLGADRLQLVGYSGGGAVAALVAARRRDILCLRTVGADLDTATWTSLQHVTPLKGSLNPADYADRLGFLPQLHLLGTADAVVAPAVVQSFLRRLPSDCCARLQFVPGLGHASGWDVLWPALLRNAAVCGQQLGNSKPDGKLLANVALDFRIPLRNNHSRAMGRGSDS